MHSIPSPRAKYCARWAPRSTSIRAACVCRTVSILLWDMQPQAGFHQRATFETWLKKRYPNVPDHLHADTVGDLVAALQRLPQVR